MVQKGEAELNFHFIFAFFSSLGASLKKRSPEVRQKVLNLNAEFYLSREHPCLNFNERDPCRSSKREFAIDNKLKKMHGVFRHFNDENFATLNP